MSGWGSTYGGKRGEGPSQTPEAAKRTSDYYAKERIIRDVLELEQVFPLEVSADTSIQELGAFALDCAAVISKINEKQDDFPYMQVHGRQQLITCVAQLLRVVVRMEQEGWRPVK